eukprot:7159175-Pyramimonas_sp.AAC.2
MSSVGESESEVTALPMRIACSSRAPGTSHTRTVPSMLALSSHLPRPAPRSLGTLETTKHVLQERTGRLYWLRYGPAGKAHVASFALRASERVASSMASCGC